MNRKERIVRFCKEVLPFAAGNLLILLFAFISLYQLWLCTRTANPFMIVFNVLLAAASAVSAALFLVYLHLPSLAERIAFSWFYPRVHLKKAPVSLSPVQGLIAAGRFEEAEQRLEELQADCPGHPEITLLQMELFADRLDRPDKAVLAAEHYFDSNAVRRNPAHFRVLMRYADLLQESGREPELIKLLESELRRNRLAKNEKASVRTRLKSLQPTDRREK